jgi:hypothetical protein
MPERDESGFAPLPDEVKHPAAASRPRARRANTALANLLTLAFIIGMIALIVVIASIWNDPFSPLNPFPPNTPFPVVVSETPNATATFTPRPTSTATETRAFSALVTPEVTADSTAPVTVDAPQPTLTFTPVNLQELLPLGTPGISADPNVPTLSPTPGFAFVVPNGRLFFSPNPEGRGGCAWSSITGTVIDFAGAPVIGYGVRIIGAGLDTTVATGSERGAGAGGFEVQVDDEASAATYTVQLLDDRGAAVSAVITVITRADCQFNIARVNFARVTP